MRYCQEIFVLRCKRPVYTLRETVYLLRRRSLDSSFILYELERGWLLLRRFCLPCDTTRQPIPAGERTRCLKWRITRCITR